MGLPIVTGGRSSSSIHLLPEVLKDIVSCSCSYCGCNDSGHPHKVAFCRSECSSLTASLTVSYFQGREEEITARMKDTDDFEFIYDCTTNIHDRCGSATRFVAVEICISDFPPSTWHTNNIARRRISKYCIRLKAPSNPSSIDESTIEIIPTYLTPRVIFSSYDRYLACLIPHGCCSGSCSGSSLVIFRLDLSTPDNKLHFPLPSFLPQDSPKHSSNSLRTAVDPRIVNFEQQNPRFSTTCICGATEAYFLAGCYTNGSILAVAWKRAKITVPILDLTTENENDSRIIISMSYVNFNPLTTGQQQGRLAVTYADGTMNIFLSITNPTTQQYLIDAATTRVLKLQLLCTLDGNGTSCYPIIDSKWINYYTLAVAVDTIFDTQKQKKDGTFVVCQVWQITSNDQHVISQLSLRTTDIKNTTARNDETAAAQQRKDHSYSKTEEQDSSYPTHRRDHGKNSIIDIDCTCHHDNIVVISSAYYCQDEGVQSFFCLWEWKSSTVGFLLGQKLSLELSRAVICHSGFLLYHVYVESNNKNTLVLDHYDLSILNPPETRSTRQSSQQQVSSLLLSSRYVSFPLCSHATLSCQANVSPDTTIDCRETRLPISYISVYGVVRVAAIGRKFCRSVAIASRRGLCILDLSHMYHLSANSSIINNVDQTVIGCHKQILPCVGTITTALAQTETVCRSHNVANKIIKKLRQIKWRMFNEYDERQFKVHAMTWWERNIGQMKQRQHNVRISDSVPFEGTDYVPPQSEDILFAVIEMMVEASSASTSRTNDSRSTNKEFHLACWSRKRLGLNATDQLLVDVDKNNNSKGITLGILLPPCIAFPSAISILSLPQNSLVYNNHADKERALLLISSLNAPYFFVVVELQVRHETTTPVHDNANASDSFHDFNRFGAPLKILGRLFQGRIRIPDSMHANESSATSALTGVFLAGGSYDFNLEGGNADCNFRDPVSPFVTIGVITNSGGLFAVSLTGKLEHSVAGLVIAQASPQSGVAFYWQSDTLITDYSFNTGCFLWTLCLRNGKMLMWSVPFFTRRDFRSLYDTAVIDNVGLFLSLSSKIFTSLDLHSHNKSSKGSLPLPVIVRPVGDKVCETPAYDRVLGEVYTLASSTLRNNWAMPGDKYFVGLFPGSLTFVLSVCQRSRRFGCLRKSSWSSDYMSNTLFCLDNCVLEPPSYTILLLSLVSQMVALKYLDSNGYRGHFDLATKLRRTVMEVAKARAIDQSLDAALRIIILSTLDMLQLTASEDNIGMLNRNLLASLLLEMVTIARDSLTPVHFSFFFLGLARQLEPRNFSILFPLRFLINTSSSDAVQFIAHENIFSRSIEHLFMECVESGTIAFAAAGLPMLKSQDASHRICVKMLHYCLEVIAEDCSSSDVEYHRLEEHTILRELFQYGLKVEDSINFFHNLKFTHTSGEIFIPRVDEAVESERVDSSSVKSGFFSNVTSRIFSIIPPTERVVDNDNEIDKDILDSAHSFVYYAPQKSSNGLLRKRTDDTSDEAVLSTTSFTPSAVKKSTHHVGLKHPTETVKTTVVIFFVSSIFSRVGFAPSSTCWKALGFISQILTDAAPPTEYSTVFCDKVSRALQNNFVIADILCETTEKLLHRHAVIMDDSSSLTTFLLSHILECSRQIGKRACADLFHFSIFLLQDLSESHTTYDVLSTELSIILLITGFLSGAHDFICEVLLDSDSKISMAFNKAVGAYNNIL